MTNPRQYKIPDWFLNRQKDIIDGKYSQVLIVDYINNNPIYCTDTRPVDCILINLFGW